MAAKTSREWCDNNGIHDAENRDLFDSCWEAATKTLVENFTCTQQLKESIAILDSAALVLSRYNGTKRIVNRINKFMATASV